MTNRALWFVAGAGAGVYAVVRGRRAAEALTVDGLTDRIGAAVLGLRMLRDEVAQGAAEKETELRGGLLNPPHGPRELVSSDSSDTTSDNTTTAREESST